MRVGIDSYSYHRLYGEVRVGEEVTGREPWALQPDPVLEHARSLGVDVVFLETCYLPEPEAITAATLAASGPARSVSPGVIHGPRARSMGLMAAAGRPLKTIWRAGSRCVDAWVTTSCASP